MTRIMLCLGALMMAFASFGGDATSMVDKSLKKDDGERVWIVPEYYGMMAKDSPYLVILESYMPKAPSEDEIRTWINANINLADYGNKMQAMKPIMAHFGGMADGNLVRQILESL